MIRTALCATLMLGMLAGCAKNEPATEDAAATSTPTDAVDATPVAAPAPASPAAQTCAQGSDCALLPPDVVLTLSRTLRNNRTYPFKPGVDRQQVVFEFNEGDTASALASIETSMRAAGFEGTARPASPTGVLSMTFRKPGYGPVNVWSNPAISGKPKSADAKGVVGFDFPASGSLPSN